MKKRASVGSFFHESHTGGNVSDYCCAVSMERGGKTGQGPPETWKFIAVLGGVECSFARTLRSDARQTETALPRLNCKQLCSEITAKFDGGDNSKSLPLYRQGNSLELRSGTRRLSN